MNTLADFNLDPMSGTGEIIPMTNDVVMMIVSVKILALA
jgi:hypothetical protein